ncbi:unnamed protein product [Leuciscus chuanchicus]
MSRPFNSRNQGKTIRRRLFLEEMQGKALVMPQMSRRQRIPRTPSASTMMEDQQQGDPNKLCAFCTDKKKKVLPPATSVASISAMSTQSHAAPAPDSSDGTVPLCTVL